MNVRSLRSLLEDYANISTDLTILSWVLMTGYCISGIFRKSLATVFRVEVADIDTTSQHTWRRASHVGGHFGRGHQIPEGMHFSDLRECITHHD
jgi:hypothetical protein